jgi:hypothetical protein
LFSFSTAEVAEVSEDLCSFSTAEGADGRRKIELRMLERGAGSRYVVVNEKSSMFYDLN